MSSHQSILGALRSPTHYTSWSVISFFILNWLYCDTHYIYFLQPTPNYFSILFPQIGFATHLSYIFRYLYKSNTLLRGHVCCSSHSCICSSHYLFQICKVYRCHWCYCWHYRWSLVALTSLSVSLGYKLLALYTQVSPLSLVNSPFSDFKDVTGTLWSSINQRIPFWTLTPIIHLKLLS
jgi:hypothetical protein